MTRTSSMPTRRIPASLTIVAFGLAAALVTARTLRQLDMAGAVREGAWALIDFRMAIYYPALAFLRGANPYDAAYMLHAYPMPSAFPLYSPATLLVHLPLAFLPLGVAEALYYAINLALFPAIAWLALRLCNREPTASAVFGIATLMVLSRPGQSTLFLGQYTACLVAALCAGLVLARHRPLLAGCALAFTTVKPSFGVPCLILLGAAGLRRPVLIGLAVAAAAALPAAAVLAVNAGGVEALLATMAESHRQFAGAETNQSAMSITRIDAVALIGHLLSAVPSTATTLALGVGVLVLGGVTLGRLARTRPPSEGALGLTALGTAVLLSVYHQAYDALLLAVPLVALALAPDATQLVRPVRVGLALLLAVPAVNYFGSFSALSALPLAGPLRGLAISLNAAALCAALLITAALVLCAPLRRRAEAPQRWPAPTGATMGSCPP
jgi:hypothetical protein